MKYKITNNNERDIITNYEKTEDGDIRVNYLDGSHLTATENLKNMIEEKMISQAVEFTKDVKRKNMIHTLKTILFYYSELLDLDKLMLDEELSDKIKYSYYLHNKDLLESLGITINDVDSYSELELKQKVKINK